MAFAIAARLDCEAARVPWVATTLLIDRFLARYDKPAYRSETQKRQSHGKQKTFSCSGHDGPQ